MERHLSAQKRYRQSTSRQTQNRRWKSRVRAAVNEVQVAVNKKDKQKAQSALTAATKEIYKARTKGALHSNTASRKVSRLSKLVASM